MIIGTDEIRISNEFWLGLVVCVEHRITIEAECVNKEAVHACRWYCRSETIVGENRLRIK